MPLNPISKKKAQNAFKKEMKKIFPKQSKAMREIGEKLCETFADAAGCPRALMARTKEYEKAKKPRLSKAVRFFKEEMERKVFELLTQPLEKQVSAEEGGEAILKIFREGIQKAVKKRFFLDLKPSINLSINPNFPKQINVSISFPGKIKKIKIK